MENAYAQRIGSLYTDNGGEFLVLSSFLAHHGINHFKTPPHTPEHNDISERRHGHIVETDLALLIHASFPIEFWSYACTIAVYLINRMPTPTLGMHSPHFKLLGVIPNYSKLRIFGCLCDPWLRPYTSHKIDTRSLPCVFLRYSISQSDFYCLDPLSLRVYVSRHVQFCKFRIPFASKNHFLSSSLTFDELAWNPSGPPISSGC